MATNNFAISSIPANAGEMRQILQDLKMAVESLVGQGQSGAPKLERSITGQDLVTLGLASQAEIEGL
jgi:hypothetical protein